MTEILERGGERLHVGRRHLQALVARDLERDGHLLAPAEHVEQGVEALEPLDGVVEAG